VTTNVILDGGGNLTLSGGGVSQIFQLEPGSTLELQNMILADGNAVNGGAIYVDSAVLRLNNVQLMNHQANYGGAIYNNGGIVTIVNGTVIEHNLATNGGGIYNYAGGQVTLAGSILRETRKYRNNKRQRNL
jgi:hypothetical protein